MLRRMHVHARCATARQPHAHEAREGALEPTPVTFYVYPHVRACLRVLACEIVRRARVSRLGLDRSIVACYLLAADVVVLTW